MVIPLGLLIFLPTVHLPSWPQQGCIRKLLHIVLDPNAGEGVGRKGGDGVVRQNMEEERPAEEVVAPRTQISCRNSDGGTICKGIRGWDDSDGGTICKGVWGWEEDKSGGGQRW
ncbi:hypothetical protein L1987_47786 [Smallanthus sonchifolius]|uniref:Uncharacterized protein n=1 Tax=Smallanthus sonchifolius TaxID=185202 RepID=A0ACB9FRA0_9ASTR|nr:hypothetical protein L1987_47786 [Smallanthus sonchifolius]